MKYFKNTELAKIYNVSEKSVRNWIQAAREGKLELQLYEKDGRYFVSNILRNTQIIESLVAKGKKYKNSRGFKSITPSQKFYDTFAPKQVLDIYSSLSIHHELPLKYSYLDGGADYWDKYAQRLLGEPTPNMLTSTISLIETGFSDLDRLLEDHSKVNLVDLGPGNGLAVKSLLEHLRDTGRLNRYIGIDISQDLLNITAHNMRSWFGTDLPFEGYVRDIDYERFGDILAQDYSSSDNSVPMNIVVFLGGTLNNLRSPDETLTAINESLGVSDILIYSTKLDTPTSRRFFDFNISSEAQELTPRHKLTLDLLGIDKSLYEVKQKFDSEKKARVISVKLKVALLLEFRFGEGKRSIELEKDREILLWRYWHQGAVDLINRFDRNNLDLLFATKSLDQEYLLLTSKIRITGE